MRFSILYGSLILICLFVISAQAGRKSKLEDENFDLNKKINNQNEASERKIKGRVLKNKELKEVTADVEDENEKPEEGFQNDESFKKSKIKLEKNRKFDDNSSEEHIDPKYKEKKKVKTNGDQEPKKFIGRIEHGKVKVLRRKEDKYPGSDDESDEDNKVKVCRKSKGECNFDSDEEEDESDENKEKKKPAKKIKYSIKFQHEKQKKKENSNGADISIMRLHKNGRRRYGKDNDDDSSEEDDSPIKRFHFEDDDD